MNKYRQCIHIEKIVDQFVIDLERKFGNTQILEDKFNGYKRLHIIVRGNLKKFYKKLLKVNDCLVYNRAETLNILNSASIFEGEILGLGIESYVKSASKIFKFRQKIEAVKFYVDVKI